MHGLAGYFQNKLVDTIHFMEILNLKDSVEKDSFFRKFPNLTEQLPRQIVVRKVGLIILSHCYWKLIIGILLPCDDYFFWFQQLLPLLASSLEFGSAAASALTALLKMGSWLSTEDFSVKVIFLQYK